MIVKMHKVYIVCHVHDRDILLDALGDLGVVHITPVVPEEAVADEKTLAATENVKTAIQILTGITPQGEAPNISAREAAAATLRMQRESVELSSRLTNLHQQIEQLRIWGDVRREQFEQLLKAGVVIKFYSVPVDQLEKIEAECIQTLTELPGKRQLVAVINRGGGASLPDQAEPIDLPKRDGPSIRGEAAEIEQKLNDNKRRLAELAYLLDALNAELAMLQAHSEITKAQKGALNKESLFALQGWVPEVKAASLGESLEKIGVRAAVQSLPPSGDEQPPTLIQYPRWAKPIEGLFHILGTVAGYDEFDVSAAFMIALPIFAAMLIGDGGYGAIMLFGPLLFYKKLAPKLGAAFTKLIIVIGAVALVWGVVSGSFFGFSTEKLYAPIIPVNMSDQSQSLLMNICFTVGAIHLSFAQFWQAVRIFPNLRFVSKIGWATFIWGMLGVVKMFLLNANIGWQTPWPYLLIVGAALAILFSRPSRNIFKMVAFGIADFPLSMLSAFSDIISYVRLMAVGLASSVLAGSFNELALGSHNVLIAVPTLVFGHGLNISLALIALFAHGVRLNMLEFSNNLGMQWTGYSYKPFNYRMIQEK